MNPKSLQRSLPRITRTPVFVLIIIISFFLTGAPLWASTEKAPKIEYGISEYSKTDQDHAVVSKKKDSKSTTDHSKLKELQGPFANGSEVTVACLSCHNKAGHQFMQNKHWTWEYTNSETGQQLGKKHLVNNFCTNARGNEGMCAQCHAGYGWKDENFDFTDETKIDCLVCHESTGTYYKIPNSEGDESCSVMYEGKPALDLTSIAKSVEMPGRNNCGKCHFYGGGGDNVKHGDLSSALFNPTKAVDVHMSTDGENFVCTTCHVGEGHEWAGSRYNMLVNDEKGVGKPGMPRDTASCESCHSDSPHPIDSVKSVKLNGHTGKVACETCHIPEIARGGVATMVTWDWRTMGKLENGVGFKLKEYTQGDGHHRATYKSIKGDFTYGENLEPTYAWFDGTMNYTTIDTQFEVKEGEAVDINSFTGSHNDPGSRIYPFKRMETTMPYDKGNNTLVYMHLWGKDENALWGNYDFGKSIKAGMEKNNIPYSGEYDFIKTYSYWPINHMVAPKEDALACQECHQKEGRLKELKGMYMPGTGNYPWVDLVGILVVLGTLGGVLLHALIRGIATRRRNK